jgi:hypothetical protein
MKQEWLLLEEIERTVDATETIEAEWDLTEHATPAVAIRCCEAVFSHLLVLLAYRAC